MKVKYRYLENSNGVYGVAYTGFYLPSETKHPDFALFLNLHACREHPLRKLLEKLTEENIPDYLKKINVFWQEIKEIEVSDDENNDWTPDLLISDRFAY